MQLDRLWSYLRSLPLDSDKPIEVVIREQVKARKPDQNALMWVGPLSDIAEQAWQNGRKYSAELWHELFKREHLPEDNDPELHLLVRSPDTYQKWAFTPNGERVLKASTKDLTVYGFSQYLTKVEADGASMGVQFHANPKEVRAA